MSRHEYVRFDSICPARRLEKSGGTFAGRWNDICRRQKPFPPTTSAPAIRRKAMPDLIFTGVIVLFFAASVLYARWCARL